MSPGTIMPETDVWFCRIAKELGNAASLSMSVLVNILEATTSYHRGKVPDPKGIEVCKGGLLGSLRLHRPAMRRGCGSASQ